MGIGLVALIAILAAITAAFALAAAQGDETTKTVVKPAASAAPAAHSAKAPTLADSKGVEFAKFEPVDANLPKVPAGAVKKFRVDVLQEVTQVHPDLAPTEAWTYAVNGKAIHGAAASPPIVVNQGDKVEVTFVNGGSKEMNVNMPHSIDFHSAEVAPNKNYIDIAPGKEIKIKFTANHAGVFMYHCATQPILLHTSAGMMGMMVVKPRNLAPVDRELWITQEEYYLGAPGKPADMNKMAAGTADVVAFNGYANQYKQHPITVKKGEKIRMYVLAAGPSKGSAFHVIGTIFDRTVVEGTVGRSSQTINLAPSQGGWVEFTLEEEGHYPFVTHNFGDMVKGAAGILSTENAPKAAAGGEDGEHGAPAAAKADVNATLGDMWVKADKTSVKAGKVTFAVKNTGATMHGLAIAPAPVNARGREHVRGQGRGSRRRRLRDADRRSEARQVRAHLLHPRPLHGRPEAGLRGHLNHPCPATPAPAAARRPAFCRRDRAGCASWPRSRRLPRWRARSSRASTPGGAPRTTCPSGRSTCSTTRCCASRCALEHIKPRLLGHWGTTPGPELRLRAPEPGHPRARPERDLHRRARATAARGSSRTPGSRAPTARSIPNVTRDEEGMRRLFRQFSFPGGIPSHVAPETPGSIHEGGELGYALAHAYGAAFDNPDLLVACVIGDGEAETGPLAASWHSNKFLNPARDGAVLPILHLNGYKIANPTVLSRITPRRARRADDAATATAPWFVEGDEPAAMHQAMAAALDEIVAEMRAIQRRRARRQRASARAGR